MWFGFVGSMAMSKMERPAKALPVYVPLLGKAPAEPGLDVARFVTPALRSVQLSPPLVDL